MGVRIGCGGVRRGRDEVVHARLRRVGDAVHVLRRLVVRCVLGVGGGASGGAVEPGRQVEDPHRHGGAGLLELQLAYDPGRDGHLDRSERRRGSRDRGVDTGVRRDVLRPRRCAPEVAGRSDRCSGCERLDGRGRRGDGGDGDLLGREDALDQWDVDARRRGWLYWERHSRQLGGPGSPARPAGGRSRPRASRSRRAARPRARRPRGPVECRSSPSSRLRCSSVRRRSSVRASPRVAVRWVRVLLSSVNEPSSASPTTHSRSTRPVGSVEATTTAPAATAMARNADRPPPWGARPGVSTSGHARSVMRRRPANRLPSARRAEISTQSARTPTLRVRFPPPPPRS